MFIVNIMQKTAMGFRKCIGLWNNAHGHDRPFKTYRVIAWRPQHFGRLTCPNLSCHLSTPAVFIPRGSSPPQRLLAVWCLSFPSPWPSLRPGGWKTRWDNGILFPAIFTSGTHGIDRICDIVTQKYVAMVYSIAWVLQQPGLSIGSVVPTI